MAEAKAKSKRPESDVNVGVGKDDRERRAKAQRNTGSDSEKELASQLKRATPIEDIDPQAHDGADQVSGQVSGVGDTGDDHDERMARKGELRGTASALSDGMTRTRPRHVSDETLAKK